MDILRDYYHQLVQRWRPTIGFRIVGLLTLLIVTTLTIVVPVLSQQKTIEISFLMLAPEVPNLRPVVQDFERQNPGIKLNVVEGPTSTNLLEDLNAASYLLGSSPYDIIDMDIVWVAKFAAAGWLKPLDKLVSAEELAKFLPGDVEGGKYNGKLYRMPWRSDAGLLFYRQDLLAKAGLQPPETFDELMQTAKTIQQQKAAKWGYLWQGKQYEGLAAMFVEVLQGYGGFWVDAQTQKVGLDRPEAIAALKFLVRTIKEGVSPPGVNTYQEDEALRFFQGGDTVFMRNWPYAWAKLNQADSPVKGKVAFKAMVHAPGQGSGAAQGGWGWGISQSSKHPKEAWQVIQYLTSAEAEKKLTMNTGYLPSRRSLYTDPDLSQRYSFFPLVLKVLEQPALRPPIAQYAQVSDILQRYLSAAISGRSDPETALRSAARETRAVLGG